MFKDDFTTISNRRSFGFSAENPTGVRGGGTGGVNKPSPCRSISPGETITLAEIDGSGRIEHIWLGGKIHHALILRMYWDNQEVPSVEVPISAFFGYAYHENILDEDGRYPFLNSSVIMTAPSIGCNCYFPMPFRKHARITMENTGGASLTTYYMITGSLGDVPENAGYFHASYRQAHPVDDGVPYTIIDGIEGKGQFLGVTLAAGLNGLNNCWVEGEARMYIDGEDTPSLHYTGTEDYFCGSYAFGNDKNLHKYQPYSGHYAGMFAVLGDMQSQYNCQRRFLLYRFHVLDPIRFEKEFRMTLDDFSGIAPRRDDFTSVAYWYQTLPTKPFLPLPPENKMYMF